MFMGGSLSRSSGPSAVREITEDPLLLPLAPSLSFGKCTCTCDVRTWRKDHTGISSEIRTKLRDSAIWQARAGCYSQAALSSNDSDELRGMYCTGISSQLRTKLRDWAVRQARASCHSQAALSSNDSKTL